MLRKLGKKGATALFIITEGVCERLMWSLVSRIMIKIREYMGKRRETTQEIEKENDEPVNDVDTTKSEQALQLEIEQAKLEYNQFVSRTYAESQLQQNQDLDLFLF